MASSLPRPVPWSVPASLPSCRASSWRGSSLLISLVVALFAVLLIATPPLALLAARSDQPKVPVPKPHLSLSGSQFA